ncbi:hypothetical protein FRX31_026278 [Thalictrum thalictroides]|uniref:Uncharacterized protein n=1 Tax=Thalictrum thalictroides TaxID=46969 RepID=A0A7J6VG99_THATH|nr:hypothetical protein FRX31_026278 [Thalictrum thalictroides]
MGLTSNVWLKQFILSNGSACGPVSLESFCLCLTSHKHDSLSRGESRQQNLHEAGVICTRFRIFRQRISTLAQSKKGVENMLEASWMKKGCGSYILILDNSLCSLEITRPIA